MTLFEGYTIDELDKILRASKWIGGICVISGVISLFFSQWMLDRISQMQAAQRLEVHKRLAEAEQIISRNRAQTAEVNATLNRLTSNRSVSPANAAALTAALPTAFEGKIIVTYSAVEFDAQNYAKEITNLLKKSGLKTELSDYIQLEFPQDGLLLATTPGEPSATAILFVKAFQSAGIDITQIDSTEIRNSVKATAGDIVIAVSNPK